MKPTDLSAYPAVSLDELLAAREQRRLRQQRAAERGSRCLISYTLNIAGPVKTFPLARLTFLEGERLLTERLAACGLSAVAIRRGAPPTGCEGLYAVDGEPARIKALAVDLEEESPLGRLLDIDVLRPDGAGLSRTEIGREERGCLLCGRPGAGCARSRRHSAEELQRETLRRMEDYFDRLYADLTAREMTRSLLYELAATPKPGLVDRHNNGSHRDMDYYTMTDGICALGPYFRACALAGLQCRDDDMPRLFGRLRQLGREAERAMFAASSGVNTYKGMVFSGGLLCGAAGYSRACGVGALSVEQVLRCCGKMAQVSLEDFRREEPRTNGERIMLRHAVSGVRGEAAGGFPAARLRALPALRAAREAGMNKNDASVYALLTLIARADDTNIIARSDLATLRSVQRELGAELAALPSPRQCLPLAEKYDRLFREKNLSAGGCADLLSVAWMLTFLQEDADAAAAREESLEISLDTDT